MTVSSNIYAEKIFAEHPVAMWLLDDPADYVSLITEAERDVTQTFWSKTNITSTAEESVSGLESPFMDSITNKIVVTKPLSGSHTAEIRTDVIDNLGEIRFDLNTFTISAYIYSSVSSEILESLILGYSYYDSGTLSWVDVEETFTNFPLQTWTLISSTFDIIEYEDFKIFFKFKVNSSGATNYDFYINGITIGQWSEEFNAISLGVQSQTLPSNIALPSSSVTPAYAYGLEENTGYYFIKNKFLTAQNTSIPMVFGAENITSIVTNTDESDDPIPSLILPGKGFLNQIGKYQEYTVEFWGRINCDSPDPLRIFGPIASNDGIYVQGGFITLSINGISSSHFVGEWYRPMLIHIRIAKDSASLLINGEQVIQLNIITSELNLPAEYITVSSVEKSQDWIGFYGYDNVYPFEIDNVSIFSYQVPELVAKRRYVYGQGVGSPENINTAFGGTTAFFDYSFSNYSVNYNYPDFAKWEQGALENLTASTKFLSTPDYSLPDIYLGDFSLNDFYSDNQAIQDETNKYITFRPNNDWDDVPAYINFPKFNFLNTPIAGFYGIFKVESSDYNDQILFKLYNRITGNSLTIKKDKHPIVQSGPDVDVISFYLNFGGTQTEDFVLKSYTVGDIISVGINIKDFASYYGGNIASFFGNVNGLELYVGGDETGDETFEGKIYDIGFCTERNLVDISSYFDSDGILATEYGDELVDRLSSYTLLIGENYGVFDLDIGISGYWQDYLPLSYFAKFVKDKNGKSYYDLDLLQFNLGYPANSLLTSETTSIPWTYDDIQESTNYSTYDQLLSYAISQIPALDYDAFSNNESTTFSFNTDNASVKSYVTFQYIEDGANLIPSSFTELTSANESKIIDISSYPDWEIRKFEIIDNNIVYPRKDIDFNDLAIVISLEFNVRGIINKKVSIDHLQIASLALNDNSFNPIGTRFGVNVFPYKKTDLYYDYKDKNPISIYKESTPYLYLTRDSGIEIRGEIDPLESRGISFPMNEKLATDYSVNAFQIWMRYDKDQFSSSPTEIFEIVGKDRVIKFYMQSTDLGKRRAKIFAITNGGSEEFIDLSYYVNGNPVLLPTITGKQWVSLGISLNSSIDLNNYLGSINLNGPLVFNNISYYKTNNLGNIETVVTRQWSAISQEDWDYWTDFTWRNVYGTFSSTELGLNPGQIYAAYTGTNKIVIDDGFGLSVDSDKIVNHTGVSWTRRYEIPV